MEWRTQKTIYELLQADCYTAHELATLLGIGEHIVQCAAFEGELPAKIIGHHIISIRREDVEVWYDARYGSTRRRPRDILN
jgi:hypothetical protein